MTLSAGTTALSELLAPLRSEVSSGQPPAQSTVEMIRSCEMQSQPDPNACLVLESLTELGKVDELESFFSSF